VKRAIGVALIVGALLVVPATADAFQSHYVACEWGASYTLMAKPRACFFTPYSGAAHYQQTPIRNIHWRSWGGREARRPGDVLLQLRLPRAGSLPALPAASVGGRGLRLHPDSGRALSGLHGRHRRTALLRPAQQAAPLDAPPAWLSPCSQRR
jgi:hypothetical protein